MKKIISTVVLISLAASMLVGCGASKDPAEEKTVIRIGTMSGPTSMGMVKLMSDAKAGNTQNEYAFSELVTDASALVAPIASGELDIAAVPSNLASTIYNNTEGKIQVISACSLGVLNLLEKGENISSIEDLQGKTIIATGQGAVPEYTIRFLLENKGMNIDSDVSMQWCSDTTEALSYVNSMDDAIAILPQPFATAACAQVDGLRVVLDLNDAWAMCDTSSEIITGVIVVRREFAEKYPEQVATFIQEYQKSVDFAQTNVDETASLIVENGIVAAEGVAKKALPGCHVVYIDGDELKTKLGGFLQVIYDMNPKAVGGSIPGDDFYFGN